MKKFLILIAILLFVYPIVVKANITCNDGTISPSCSNCHQGCCSHHGGCLDNSYKNSNLKNSEKDDDNSLAGIGVITILAGGIIGGVIAEKKGDNK